VYFIHTVLNYLVQQCEVKRNQSEGFTEHWDDIIQAKHCIFKNETTGVADQWFAYEDVESLEAKVSVTTNQLHLVRFLKIIFYHASNIPFLNTQLKLLHSLPVGGGMVWSIETDDFHNVCGKGVNPLLHYLAESLQGGSLVTPDPQVSPTRSVFQSPVS
jgi:hypothetical protein